MVPAELGGSWFHATTADSSVGYAAEPTTAQNSEALFTNSLPAWVPGCTMYVVRS